MENPSNPKETTRAKDNDGLHKRRGIWHYKVKFHGRWKEISTGTRSYQEARKLRQQKLAELAEGRLDIDRGKWTLRRAADEFVSLRQGERLAANTLRIEKERLKPLLASFGEKRLSTFSIDDVKAYRIQRLSHVSPRTVNMEVKLLRMVLQWAKCWGRLADDYKPLRENSRGPGIALSPEQERRLFETAAGKQAWEQAYLAAVLSVNTTMRSVEIRNLRIGDIDLMDKKLFIRREATKTDAGSREIPLNETAIWAILQLLRRAEKLGSSEPEHFLFPAYCFRKTKAEDSVKGSGYDPTKPIKGWRTAWRALKKEAGLPNLRFHDLRHTSITKLAEAGVADHVLMSISGHISPEMIRHYSHIRSQAKRNAVESIRSFVPTHQAADANKRVH